MANTTKAQVGFHAYQDATLPQYAAFDGMRYSEFTYTFENFFHPFVGNLIEKLNKESLSAMLDSEFHQNLSAEFFEDFYKLPTTKEVKANHFPKEIDVREHGTYANYNWEMLFHIPLTIAVHLSKNQRFAEAQRWFHFIFDPTDTTKHYWKFIAFRKQGEVKQIDELLTLLSKPAAECSPTELAHQEKIKASYQTILDKPFQPHAVARTRHLAYQYTVVMKYLDNLIAWGDNLFRQDTIESINEATQLYVLAANLLGTKPQRIPTRGTFQPKTFSQLKAKGLDVMGNTLVELESQFPFNLGLPQTKQSDAGATRPLFGIGRTLYFCVPPNDKLLSYWDTVADRLFKIRHCMNIEGVTRQLALFDPPIDPGMLVKAAAAGIPIGAIISGLNQPISPVRSLYFIQKALELAGEVRGLGSALLTAIEKKEGEHLSLLRQEHEIKIQQMQQDVLFLRWKQAEESTNILLKSRASALERYRYYQRVLNIKPDKEEMNLPDTFTFERSTTSDDSAKLTEENFNDVYAAYIGQYDKLVASSLYPQHSIVEDGTLRLLPGEYNELNVHAEKAFELRNGAAGTEALVAVLALIPDFSLKAAFWGVGSDARIAGGTPLSAVQKAFTTGFDIAARDEEMQGQNSSKTASYERRADEWIQSHNLAAHELMQIGRQIISSLIAEQIVHHEYLNLKKQIENAQAVDHFLHEKFTNEELYTWMQGETSRLYYEYYRFAFDTASKAEQTMKRELMRPEVDATDYIKFNYWDGGRKGLLSGEALYLDLKRMEMAYHEHNKREFELAKHVSLRQLNPMALLVLVSI